MATKDSFENGFDKLEEYLYALLKCDNFFLGIL